MNTREPRCYGPQVARQHASESTPSGESAVERVARLVACILSTLAVLLFSRSETFSAEAEVRTAWVTQVESEVCAYVQLTDKTWVFSRPNVKLGRYSEVERTDSEIVVQNIESKLFIRLTADRAYWRKPDQDMWKTYLRGSWGEAPKVVLDWIDEKQGPMSPSGKTQPGKSQPDGSEDTAIAEEQDYRVHVIYFVPSDRDPVANWQRKLHVVMQFVNSMFQNDLAAKGLKTSGLQYDMDNGFLRSHLVRGIRPAVYYNNAPGFEEREQFRRVKEELTDNGFGNGTLRIVFCENYDYGPSDRAWNGTIALGGYESAASGLAMYSAHLLRDEFCALTMQEQVQKFFDQTPVPGRRAGGHRMNSPRCEFVEDGFGSVIHELGHALGLSHDKQSGKMTIMGNGFRNMRRNLSPSTPLSQMVTFSDFNTHLLMSSRFLNPELDRTDETPPKASLAILDVAPGTGQVRLSVTATDENVLRVFGIHDDNAEDGDFIAGTPLDSNELSTELTIKAQLKDGGISLKLIVADNGGNLTRRGTTWP
ncbi:MAG: hypothetical protein R3C59_29765 [Planctomycetaceae bacterium]